MPAARSRTEVLALLALLVMTAAWGSTFFLIKDVVTRIPPADLLALVNTAKRMAMNRMKEREDTLPPLIWDDFRQALKRNIVLL